MAVIRKKSPAPFYAVAALWVIWGLFFPLYSILHFLLLLACSLVVFLAGKAVWKDKVITIPDPKPEPKPEPKPVLAPEIQALIDERDRAVSEMRRLNDAIEDPKISMQIDHLEEVTKKIADVVAGRPEKLTQIRKFLNYYLPTTLKLLNAYDRMDSAGVAGANIDGTMGKIETMMDTVVQAFDKQLDSLFSDEALDISTDITVMEQMLAREGIGGAQMPGQ